MSLRDSRTAGGPATAIEKATAVEVWPLWQRALHWLLATAVIVALVTYRGGVLHESAGYLALLVASLRVLLGFLGPRPARFASFVRGPAAVLAHARALFGGQPERHINHTPLGGWMVVALLALAVIGGASGALYVTDRFWGDATMISAHAIATWSLAALAPLHLLGVLHASAVHRENLVRAMIDGKKCLPLDAE